MVNNVALIVDTSFLVHRQLAMPNVASLRTKNGMRTGGIFGTLRSLSATVREIQDLGVVVCCFDSYPAYRKFIYPEYKANRKSNPDSPEYQEFIAKDQFGWSTEDMNNFTYDTLKTLLPKMKVKTIYQENVEGDDAVFQSAKYLSSKGYKCIVMSDDRDFLQIVNEVPNCEVYRVMAKETITKDNLRENQGVAPEWYIIFKAMCGDGSDGIPGVASGFGPGAITQLINEAESRGLDPDDPDTLDKLVELAQSWNDKGKARIQKFDKVARDQLELNLKIMDFRKCPYPDAALEELKSKLDEHLEFDNMYLLQKFKEYEFSSLGNILTDIHFRKLL